MKNRFYLALFGSLSVCVLLSACGKKAPPESPLGQPDGLTQPYPPEE